MYRTMKKPPNPGTQFPFSFLCTFIFVNLVTSVCYYPSGITALNPIYQPCISISGTTSMCCARNRTNPAGGDSADGTTSDECLANGLCRNVLKYNTSDGQWLTNTTYWRNQCTSEDWTDSGCLNVCTKTKTPNGGSDNTIKMTSCDGTDNSTTWCCGDNTSCCNTTSAITIAQKLGEPTPTLSSVSSSSSTSISKSNSTLVSSSTSTSTQSTGSSSSHLSSGAVVGISVGSVLGAIVVLAVITVFLIRHRRAMVNGNGSGLKLLSKGPRSNAQLQELEDRSRTVAHEKASGPQDIRAELPGHSVQPGIN